MSAIFFVVHNVAPLWLLGMWAASVRWVQMDARTRLATRSGIRAAVLAAALLPLLGVALWACARPPETRLERRARRLRRLLLELEASPPVVRGPVPPAPQATEERVHLGSLAAAET